MSKDRYMFEAKVMWEGMGAKAQELTKKGLDEITPLELQTMSKMLQGETDDLKWAREVFLTWATREHQERYAALRLFEEAVAHEH